jgi:SAM-dependent methyltransferase
VPLAYYARAATEEFWSEHWGGQDVDALLAVARRSPLTGLIESALPPGGMVLEAGCGLGQYVILLRERGRRAAGVDWSLDALRRCRAAAAGTPTSVMDLTALGVRDGAVAAYLSLGVVEHDPAGPDSILAEAHRVLASGGRLVLSVPYVNGVRRVFRPYLARRQDRLHEAGGEFYQYAFTRREVGRFLAARGFEALSLTPYDPARLLRKALGRVRPAAASEPAQPSGRRESASSLRRLARSLLYADPALRLLGHMILAVAVKR